MDGILFDARVIRPGMTGIGNYTRHLLRALPAHRVRIGLILPHGSAFAEDFYKGLLKKDASLVEINGTRPAGMYFRVLTRSATLF